MGPESEEMSSSSLTPIGPSITPIGVGEWLFHTLCYFSISRETLNTFVLPFLSCLISTLFPVLRTRRIFLIRSASSAARRATCSAT